MADRTVKVKFDSVEARAAMMTSLPSRETWRNLVAGGDLVDYLRDKLEHADDVVCTCPDVDISDWSDRAANRRHTTKGRDPLCPEHGGGWIRE